MEMYERIVQSAAELGATQALVNLGVCAGVISQRRAAAIYGKWFAEAVKAGRIRPCRIDGGARRTHHYQVKDILELRTADLVSAQIQLSKLNKS